MPDLALQFPREDDEFRAALERQFGDDAAIADVKSFDGVAFAQAVVTVVLPLAPLWYSTFSSAISKSAKERIASHRRGRDQPGQLFNRRVRRIS